MCPCPAMSSVSTDPPTYVQRENDNEDNSGKDRIALKEKVISQTNNYTRQMLSIGCYSIKRKVNL